MSLTSNIEIKTANNALKYWKTEHQAVTSAMKNTANSESISAEVHRINHFDGQTKHHPHRLGSVS